MCNLITEGMGKVVQHEVYDHAACFLSRCDYHIYPLNTAFFELNNNYLLIT